MNKEKIITLEVAPIIEFKGLKEVGILIDDMISGLNIDAQIATEESLKTLKDMKSNLNKDFAIYEDKRKEIKKAIDGPYSTFLAEYNSQIRDRFDQAVPKLTKKIAFVEDDLKNQKREKLSLYFDEYCSSCNIDFINFENVGLNVTRSASDNKLKKEISYYIDKIAKDVNLISNLGEDKDYTAEVTADFYITLDAAQSISNVNNARLRKAKIAEQQKEAQKVKESDVKVEQKIEPLQAPKVDVEDPEQRVIEASFKVKASVAKLRLLKQYMIDNNIEIL